MLRTLRNRRTQEASDAAGVARDIPRRSHGVPDCHPT
jgi:hypothetical protein